MQPICDFLFFAGSSLQLEPFVLIQYNYYAVDKNSKGTYLRHLLSYLHRKKPVLQYVRKPEDWVWSSANPESDIVIESLVF
jgi:hypothetical protein